MWSYRLFVVNIRPPAITRQPFALIRRSLFLLTQESRETSTSRSATLVKAKPPRTSLLATRFPLAFRVLRYAGGRCHAPFDSFSASLVPPSRRRRARFTAVRLFSRGSLSVCTLGNYSSAIPLFSIGLAIDPVFTNDTRLVRPQLLANHTRYLRPR